MRAVRVAVSYCYSRCSAEEEEVDRLKSWRSTNFFGESLSKQEKRHYGLLELGFLEKFQTPAPLFILVVSPQTLYHTSSLLASTQESRPFFFQSVIQRKARIARTEARWRVCDVLTAGSLVPTSGV
jgi:hypothetical protein